MSIATVITQGIGPGSSIPAVILDGYSTNPVGDLVYTETRVIQDPTQLFTLQSDSIMNNCACFNFNIYLDRANIQELVLRYPNSQGGAALVDLSPITRVIFTVNGYSIDSSTAPTAIWWTDTVMRTITIDGAEESFNGNVLKLQVGPELATAGLTVGEYDECCLVIYDAAHTEGTVYSNNILADVSSSCGA